MSIEHFLAHSANDVGDEDYLKNHLLSVAEQARHFARELGIGDESFICGLIHDLGKYGDFFQRRLEGLESGIDHWSAGAWLALRNYELNGIASALAIQGHHLGLQAANNDSIRSLNLEKLAELHPENKRLSEQNLEVLKKRLEKDGIDLPDKIEHSNYSHESQFDIEKMLDIRMLFSILVDADYLETEAHFNADTLGKKKYRPAGPPLNPEIAYKTLIKFIKTLKESSNAPEKIRTLREDLHNSCIEAAYRDPGLFTLTAPTGSGKTLSMLAFALKHAIKNNLLRIIVVIPYLTIIEQTVNIYRNIFKSTFPLEYIIEDHSMAGTKSSGQEAFYNQSRLLAENWDAPVIITTSVQLLESIFANRPSTCRKLHRLARSIILFDEVQTLPTNIIIPTLASLSHISNKYKSSIVFSTATQPAFNHLNRFISNYCQNGWQPQEIVPGKLKLFDRIIKTKVDYAKNNTPIQWDTLAGKISQEHQVLCILNLKKHALKLFDRLKEYNCDNLFHLSTNMCPAHRQIILGTIQNLLENGASCRLVSTQCIEAGVDIDFPVVFRAMAPFDALTQSAGRCNRNAVADKGLFHIFLPEEEDYPGGAYKQAASIAKIILGQNDYSITNIDDPQLHEQYYCELYDINKPENQNPKLTDSIERLDFVDTAKEYRLIPNSSINILVPFDETYDSLAREARENGLNSRWIRRARPYSISIYRPKSNNPIQNYLEPINIGKHGEESRDWFIYLEKDHYDIKKGLVSPQDDILIG